jgi:hypothetical protein
MCDSDGWIGPGLVYANQQFRIYWSFAGLQELEKPGSGHDFRIGELVDQIVKLPSIRHGHLLLGYAIIDTCARKLTPPLIHVSVSTDPRLIP